MNWYLEVLKKYAEFNGRASRQEYWFFMLFNILISAFLATIDFFGGSFNVETGVGLLSGHLLIGRPDSRHSGNGSEAS